MMDGIPFVTFTWEIEYRTYFRKDTNFKLGRREPGTEIRRTRKERDIEGRERREYLPFQSSFVPREKPASLVSFTTRQAYVSCVVVVDVRTAQFGSIMAWNWNLED